MDSLLFSYKGFQDIEINYSDKYNCYMTLDKVKYDRLEDEFLKQDERIDSTLTRLSERVTEDYYLKVHPVQLAAQTYARKVFPTYRFIQSDTIVDDWLSTVDFHSEKKTRDHSLHQTLTAYIVSQILGQGDCKKGLLLPNGKTMLEQCAEQLLQEPEMEYLRNYIRKIDPTFRPRVGEYNEEWAAEVFYEAAFVSALFHDMGYPWQYVTRLSNSIKDANYAEVNGTILDASKAVEEMEKNLLIFPFYGYHEGQVLRPSDEQHQKAVNLIEKGLFGTHGVPGAIGFMSLNDRIRYIPKKDALKEASFKLIMDWAALGIMMHDMPKVYWGEGKKLGIPENNLLRLDCKKDPLSCIIALADVLEEFERPKTFFKCKEDEIDGKFVALKYGYSCVGSRLTVNSSKLYITYLYESLEEAKDQESDRRNEIQEYLGANTGFLDLSRWGITEGLANVDVSDLE